MLRLENYVYKIETTYLLIMSSITNAEASSAFDNGLTLEFGPLETVHRWNQMPECDEFVGAR